MVSAYELGQYACIAPTENGAPVLTRHSIGWDTIPASIGFGNAKNNYIAKGKLMEKMNSEYFADDEEQYAELNQA